MKYYCRLPFLISVFMYVLCHQAPIQNPNGVRWLDMRVLSRLGVGFILFVQGSGIYRFVSQ
jgi:hypothetical protein